MFIVGIDPHKGSHTAAVLDGSETVIGELGVSADGRQQDRLLEFAADFTPRTWAIESASGLGVLLAQQLVAAGETCSATSAASTNQLVAIDERIGEAVLATGTTVTDIHGIGPLGAAIILGHTGDIARFPTSGHYARYNGSAPIAASSGPITDASSTRARAPRRRCEPSSARSPRLSTDTSSPIPTADPRWTREGRRDDSYPA
jgi:transposase